MPKVLIATQKPFHPSGVQQIKDLFADEGYEVVVLEKYSDKSELLAQLNGVEAIIVRSDKITREVIEVADSLKIVVRAGAGYDNVDLDAATEKGVVVMNTPGQNSNAVAELVLGMMVYFARNKFNGTSGTEIRNKKVGIHAYGNVGRYVGEIANGFGAKVYGYDPYVPNDLMSKDNVTAINDTSELYEICQFISLHVPCNEKTRDSINYSLMSSMPAHGVLVNTARKEVVNEEDLLKIFEERDDFYYLSDIAPDCKDVLLEKYPDRVYFTPKKMGAQTVEANINAGVAAAKQIIKFFKKGDKTFQVNS